MQFIADLYFWLGIQRVLSSRLQRGGSGKNYLYRFDVDLSQNFVKKLHVEEAERSKYPGASHCDELPYLFKTSNTTKIPSPAIDSKEFEMINTMVETFTTFAATGDPNNRAITEKWEAVDSKELSCLNINQSEIKMIPLPEGERLKKWNEIFQRENVELY